MTETAENLKHAFSNAKAWLESIEEMLARYRSVDDPTSRRERDEYEARREIEESVLSVLVRDGWHQVGVAAEDGPEEYEILLSTGGPALRIYGRLNDFNEPESAELQAQDWGTPWTRYPASEETLLEFARVFYFGEG